MSEEPKMTLCAKCVHHRNAHGGHQAGPKADSWFYPLCTHPELEHPKVVDPVSGKVCYWTKNDLGTTIPTDHPHPLCRKVNDGTCKR